MYGEPHFDQHAFDNRRIKAVSKETEISFQDLQRMHVERRAVQQVRRLPTPLWATNNQQVRQVVLRYAEDRYYIREHSGTDAERMARIQAVEQSKLPGLRAHLEELLQTYHKSPQEHLPVQIQNKDSEILNLERGVVKLATAVVYLYFRQGYKSVDIAEELKLKSPMIRMWLYRLNTIANRLGLQQGPPVRNSNHKSYQRPPKNSIYYGSKEDALKLFALRGAGATWLQCRAVLKLRHPWAAKIMWLHHFGDLKVGHLSTKPPQLKGTTPCQARRVQRLRTLFLLRTNGKTWEQCGQRLGIGERTALSLWKRHFGELNVSPNTRQLSQPREPRVMSKWTPERIAQLKSLLESGKTFRACAETLGLKRPQQAYNVYARYIRVKR